MAQRARVSHEACFNFTTVDEELMGELEKLSAAVAAKFHSKEFIQHWSTWAGGSDDPALGAYRSRLVMTVTDAEPRHR
ncbi:MAG TPA: hypothetical protein VKM93_06390 [Terriglobia bacterium]|nr:hypothetical protein [Terriglobia bacterium]